MYYHWYCMSKKISGANIFMKFSRTCRQSNLEKNIFEKTVHTEIKLPLSTLSLNLWFPWNFSKIKITSDLTIYQKWNDNYPLHCEKFDTWVIIPHCVHCGLTGKGFRAFFLLSNHHHWDSKPSQATAQKPLWTHCVE